MMKMRIFLMLILAMVLAGTGRAEVVLDVTFGHLGYDADGLTSDGQLCVDSSANGYHGFYAGGSGAVAAVGVTGSTALDTSGNDVYVILRDDRTYSSHGEFDIADPITTPTPYFTLEADKSYTFEAILKWDPASTDAMHGIMGQIGGNEFWFRENGGALQWAMVSDGFNANNFGAAVDISALEADGQWHHIALVLDRTAAEIRIYADYELIYTHTAGVASLGAILNGEGDFRLGAYNNTASARFDGQQDHYRISNTALKPYEFLQIDSASAPTPADGAKGVLADADLSWTSAADPNAPGEVITGQYVYLGTDPTALVLQNPTALAASTFDPGTLTKDTRYYWRVDGQVNNGPANDPNLIVPGLVWTFQTQLSLPVIDANPKDDRVFVDTGENAEFTVLATNPLGGEPDYQWYEGVSPDTSSPLAGATTATLTIANVTAGDVGRQFYCSVSNINGSVDTTSAAILAKTQVAHWKLDDIGQTEPNAIDSSANGYDGTNVGATQIAEGKIDEAFAFNGNAYVDLTDHLAVFSGLQEGTITAWVKTSNTFGVILSAYDSTVGSTEGRLFMEYGNLRWDVRDEGGTPAGEDGQIVGPVISDNQWHMVALTVDGSRNAVMYVDGVAVAEGEEPFWGQIGQLDGIAIGRNVDSGSAPNGQWFFNGQLDDIQVYDYAMTANEIADEYVAIDGPICVEEPRFDLNDDCKVDLSDILELAATWLDCNRYPQSACN